MFPRHLPAAAGRPQAPSAAERPGGEEHLITAKLDFGLVGGSPASVVHAGQPEDRPSHYPDHPQAPDGSPRPPKAPPRSDAERAFLALGPGAHAWLVEAAAAGAQRVRSKMHVAVELAALVGVEPVDAARLCCVAGSTGMPMPCASG